MFRQDPELEPVPGMISPAPPRRWTIGRAMLAVALLAIGLAVFRSLFGLGLAAVLVLVAVSPRRPGWASTELLLASLWLLWLFVECSQPFLEFDVALIIVPTFVIVGLSWLARLVWLLFRWPAPLRIRGRQRTALALTPIMLLIGLLFLVTDLERGVGLALSEPALLREVRSTPPGGGSNRARYVGLIRVRETEALGGCVYFFTPGGFLERVGIVYAPAGTRPTRGGFEFTHFAGNWWKFSEGW